MIAQQLRFYLIAEFEFQQPVAVEIDGDAVALSQMHLAEFCLDHTIIEDVGRHQPH